MLLTTKQSESGFVKQNMKLSCLAGLEISCCRSFIDSAPSHNALSSASACEHVVGFIHMHYFSKWLYFYSRVFFQRLQSLLFPSLVLPVKYPFTFMRV